jgi:Coenzyme PQQ synthesis protein D (PqqD)
MDELTSIPQEHVVATDFEGGDGVLVDLNAKRYYQLNETAMLIWQGLEERRTFAQLVELMTTRYEVSSDHAAASIERCIRELETHKLVSPR